MDRLLFWRGLLIGLLFASLFWCALGYLAWRVAF